VYMRGGAAGVLLIRFTSAYQEYKGNERPAWCAISELRRVHRTAGSLSLPLWFPLFLVLSAGMKGRWGETALETFPSRLCRSTDIGVNAREARCRVRDLSKGIEALPLPSPPPLPFRKFTGSEDRLTCRTLARSRSFREYFIFLDRNRGE